MSSSISKLYALAACVYGRGDASLGDDPSHVALMQYAVSASTGTMHHARCPSGEQFIYERRSEQDLLTDPVMQGRAVLVDDLNDEQAVGAEKCLALFGADRANLPYMGEGNCQNWLAGAIWALEGAGLVRKGDGLLWDRMIGDSAETVRRKWAEAGRTWIPNAAPKWTGKVDAKYHRHEEVAPRQSVRSLKDNPTLWSNTILLMDAMKEKREVPT